MRQIYTMNVLITNNRLNMALFNLFKKKPEEPNLSLVLSSEKELDTEVSQDTESSDIQDVAPVASSTLKVSYATGWPIDLIYGYLHKNYEEKGYADAMLNSNLTFRDMNMSIIRNKVLMVFREVNLKYDGMKRELETRIGACSAAGLLTSVAELEKQMAVINAHKEELSRLEMDFRNNANEASVPLMSYECGFLRGVSAIAMSSPTSQSETMPQMSATSFFSANRVTA